MRLDLTATAPTSWPGFACAILIYGFRPLSSIKSRTRARAPRSRALDEAAHGSRSFVVHASIGTRMRKYIDVLLLAAIIPLLYLQGVSLWTVYLFALVYGEYRRREDDTSERFRVDR